MSANHLSVDTSGGGNDAFNPKSPLEARMTRRRLSVVAGSEDTEAIDKHIDGTGPEADHKSTNRRASVVEATPQPIFSRYAALSKVGYVPFNPNKVNQDRAYKVVNYGGDEQKAFFGCFDGHGSLGHEVSQFVSTKLPDFVLRQPTFESDPVSALITGFVECNTALTQSCIDCTFSGSTAIVCYLHDKKLYSANAGDSRAVLAKRTGNNTYRAVPLSDDQKPDREDELKRIIECKGRVEACKDSRGNDVGPKRVWLQYQDIPGLAMARAFGDQVASSVGVTAKPEVWVRDIVDEDAFMILGSDGIWEFISNEEAVQMVQHCDSPQAACRILVDESIRRWQAEEEVIDDITCMVIYL